MHEQVKELWFSRLWTMSELCSDGKGSTWLLVRRGATVRKIMEIALLRSDGIWCPFLSQFTVETENLYLWIGSRSESMSQESKREARESVHIYCYRITTDCIESDFGQNGLKLSVIETMYACITLFSSSGFVLTELCFKKYILKCD